jgi:predicted peptidase
MRPVLRLLWPALFAAAGLFHAAAAQQERRFTGEVTKRVALDYLLFLPADYRPEGPKHWPLLLFLHGAGERGTNLARVKVHGPPKLVETNAAFPFIVVSPQCPPGQRWDPQALLLLLDDVMAGHPVDPERVYVTGLSMGGYGTWALAAAAPERFAAVAPICGGGDPIAVRLAGGGPRADALKTLGVWAFHGAKDEVVRLSESERMVEAYKNLGATPKLTVYPEAAHDSWTETYANPALYEWLLRHRRVP